MQVNKATVDALEEILDEEKKSLIRRIVVDEKDHKVGTVHSLHQNAETGKTDFIVVSAGWLSRHLFVVPVAAVQLTPDRKHLRLPFSRAFIEEAPTSQNAKVISYSDTVLARSYFLGEVPAFRPEDVVVESLNRPRRPPGYDPNDTGITGN